MSDETFPITLGGRTWALEHLPFRVLKKAQPKLLLRGNALYEGGGNGVLLRLDEEALDDLAETAFLAVSVVDPSLTREAFLELRFTSADLLAALPNVMKACGLAVGARGLAEEKKT